jgi:hypothetical protein
MWRSRQLATQRGWPLDGALRGHYRHGRVDEQNVTLAGFAGEPVR